MIHAAVCQLSDKPVELARPDRQREVNVLPALVPDSF